MSRRRTREAVSPSLFPFLAVLLCTMGSLVLILMLIVSGAQASARKIADEVISQKEETEATIQLASSSYARQLEEGQFELEKKRLMLQHFEEHIRELLDELDQLKSKAQLLESESQLDTSEAEDQRRAISELEKQLAEAEEELKQKLAKPDGDKPIFAVIPYQGNNGTHRRPIYVECVSNGIIIQPEGVFLSETDLQPPHGPGNPLDAALRAIRSEYKPANGAITETAYPLLIVRPSGIRSYTYARSAMNGWDDQFGYELVSDGLELVFPESKPGLKDKIAQTVDLARNRQSALVAAMPRKYKGYSALRGGNGGGSSGTSNSYSGNPGGFESGGSYGSGTGNSGSLAGSSSELGIGTSSIGASPSELNGMPQNFGSGGLPNQQQGAGLLSQTGTQNKEQGYQFFGSNGSGNSSFTPGSAANSGDLADSGGASQSGPSDSASAGAQQSLANQFESGNGGGEQQGSGSSSSAVGTPSSGGAAQATNSNMAGNPGPQDQQQQGGMPSLAAQLGQSRNSNESASAVAASRGRNWAWSRGPATQTPVVRSIHLHCFADRWVLIGADGSPERGTTISFDDKSPEERAIALASAVKKRVESWGLALTGGYWRPVLVVDVAPQAKWRFDQLQRLMDGSGVEIKLRESKP